MRGCARDVVCGCVCGFVCGCACAVALLLLLVAVLLLLGAWVLGAAAAWVLGAVCSVLVLPPAPSTQHRAPSTQQQQQQQQQQRGSRRERGNLSRKGVVFTRALGEKSFRYSTKLPLFDKASVIQQGIRYSTKLPLFNKGLPARDRPPATARPAVRPPPARP